MFFPPLTQKWGVVGSATFQLVTKIQTPHNSNKTPRMFATFLLVSPHNSKQMKAKCRLEQSGDQWTSFLGRDLRDPELWIHACVLRQTSQFLRTQWARSTSPQGISLRRYKHDFFLLTEARSRSLIGPQRETPWGAECRYDCFCSFLFEFGQSLLMGTSLLREMIFVLVLPFLGFSFFWQWFLVFCCPKTMTDHSLDRECLNHTICMEFQITHFVLHSRDEALTVQCFRTTQIGEYDRNSSHATFAALKLKTLHSHTDKWAWFAEVFPQKLGQKLDLSEGVTSFVCIPQWHVWQIRRKREAKWESFTKQHKGSGLFGQGSAELLCAPC